MSKNTEQETARKSRMVALVIASAMVLWLLANVVGRSLGLPVRFAFLFDFLAIAALIWSIFVIYQIRKKR